MNEQCSVTGQAIANNPLSFRDRFAVSPQFKAIFEEGMSLVERTAIYLDVEGRREAKALKPPASLAYATESMRLTTRLMQLASWLLLRRAVTNREITEQQARCHERRVRLVPQTRQAIAGYDELPPEFLALIDESYRLYDRILRLDRLISDIPAAPFAGPPAVVSQIERIRLAFPAA